MPSGDIGLGMNPKSAGLDDRHIVGFASGYDNEEKCLNRTSHASSRLFCSG